MPNPEVKVKITAQDQTAAVISNVERQFAGLASSVEGLGAVMSGLGVGLAGGGIVGAVTAVEMLVDKTVEMEAGFYRASKSTAMSVTALSALREVSGETGESFESLTKALAILGKNIAIGIDEPSSKAAKVLKALRIDPQQLRLEGVDARINTVISAIYTLSDANERQLALATMIGQRWMSNAETFERIGTESLPAIIGGTNRLNLVTEEQGRISEEALEKRRKFYAYLEGEGRLLTDNLIPAWSAFLELMTPKADTEFTVLKEQRSRLEGSINSSPFYAQAPKDQVAGIKAQIAALDEFMDKQRAEAEFNELRAAQLKKANAPAPGAIAAALSEGSRKGGGDNALAERMRAVAEKQRELSAAMREYAQVLDSLMPSENAFQKATKEYQTTLDRLVPLELKGVDTTLAKTEALKRYNQQLGDALQKSLEMESASKRGISLFGGPGDLGKTAGGQPGAPMDKFFQMIEYGDLRDSQAQLEKMGTIGQKFGEQMSSSFAQMIVYGRGFTQMLQGALDMLIKLVLEALVFQPLSNMFGGSSGGFLGGFFGGMGGARASGGDVYAGSSYLIGEEGPEIFTPASSGSIAPNSALGDRLTVNYNVDARGADAFADKRLLLAMQMTRQAAVNQALNQVREAKLRSAR